MKKTILAVVLGLSAMVAQADVRNVLQTLEQGHDNRDWNTVISTYRGAKNNPDIKSWFLRKANTGHPMYMLERANEELEAGRVQQASSMALKAYVHMTGDIALCMDMDAKKLALQHMASYQSLNQLFNQNQAKTLGIVNNWIRDMKKAGNDVQKYDYEWVCSLTNKENMIVPKEKKDEIRSMAMLTYLVVTRSTLELTNEIMDLSEDQKEKNGH